MPILWDANQHTLRHISQADDAGTIERDAKFLLNRCINNMTTAREVASTTFCSMLLGQNSEHSSHDFTYAFPVPAISAAVAAKQKQHLGSESFDPGSADFDFNSDSNSDNIGHAV